MKKEFSNLNDIYELSIIKIEALAEYTILVTYSNKEVISYSLKSLLKNKLSVLKDEKIFQRVFIDEFGNVAWDIDKTIDSNINWDNRIDISKENIYIEGTKIK